MKVDEHLGEGEDLAVSAGRRKFGSLIFLPFQYKDGKEILEFQIFFDLFC